MTDMAEPLTAFTTMDHSTQADWAVIGDAARRFYRGLPDRVLVHLRLLDGDFGGFAVDRLTHSLQCATRAYRDGRDEEYVVCALLHDIGDTLASYNHHEVAVAILSPFISAQNLWMLEKHAVFQGYYFFHHLGLDRDLREEHRGHEWFNYTAEFCELYDQTAFDPGYDTMPLEAFEPMVRSLMAKPKRSLYKRHK